MGGSDHEEQVKVEEEIKEWRRSTKSRRIRRGGSGRGRGGGRGGRGGDGEGVAGLSCLASATRSPAAVGRSKCSRSKLASLLGINTFVNFYGFTFRGVVPYKNGWFLDAHKNRVGLQCQSWPIISAIVKFTAFANCRVKVKNTIQKYHIRGPGQLCPNHLSPRSQYADGKIDLQVRKLFLQVWKLIWQVGKLIWQAMIQPRLWWPPEACILNFKTLCWRQIKAWLAFSVCVDKNFDIVYFFILTFLCKKEMGPIVTWLTSFLLSFMWEPPGGMPPSKGVPVATKDCTEISHKKTNTFLKRQMIRKKTNIAQKDKRLRWNIGIWIRSRNTKDIRSYPNS